MKSSSKKMGKITGYGVSPSREGYNGFCLCLCMNLFVMLVKYLMNSWVDFNDTPRSIHWIAVSPQHYSGGPQMHGRNRHATHTTTTTMSL